MNIDTFKRTLVSDDRVKLCDLSLTEGTLRGTVEKGLEPTIQRYAAENGFTLSVGFPEPHIGYVRLPHVHLRTRPHASAEHASDALYGEVVEIYDSHGDYCRVATLRDNYLGWVHKDALAGQLPEATHEIRTLRGHLFDRPSVAGERVAEFSYGTTLHIEGQEGDWSSVRLEHTTAYIRNTALVPKGAPQPLPTRSAIVAFAKGFLETPYVWGGSTAWGLDCSGLVQTVYRAHGLTLPRDADQQEASGQEITRAEAQGADFFFFPGHVAIALDSETFIHANGEHMRVTINRWDENDYTQRLLEKLTKTVRVCGVQEG